MGCCSSTPNVPEVIRKLSNLRDAHKISKLKKYKTRDSSHSTAITNNEITNNDNEINDHERGTSHSSLFMVSKPNPKSKIREYYLIIDGKKVKKIGKINLARTGSIKSILSDKDVHSPKKPIIIFNSDNDGKNDDNKMDNKSDDDMTVDIEPKKTLERQLSVADALKQYDIFTDITEYDPKRKEDYQLMADIMLDEMINAQNRPIYKGLREIYDKYCNNITETMTEIQLFESLKEFGIFFVDKKLSKDCWALFDIENEGLIDFTDFQAVLSSFILAKNDNNETNILLKLFDLNLDGYLTEKDVARLLLCLDHISHIINGKSLNEIKLSKNVCLRQAQMLLINIKRDKVSYNELKNLILKKKMGSVLLDKRVKKIIQVSRQFD